MKEPRDIVDIVERIAKAASDAQGSASVSIGVRSSGAPDVIRSDGFADLENDVLATPQSVYRIGSLTKQFTAAAIMLLVERGALKLDDGLGRLIPDYPAHGYGITIQHLLTHTSGIRNYTEIPEFAEKSRLDLSHRELATLFASKPLDFQPGERYRYNNSGYYLLGVIIELVSHQPYYEFMQREIFTPLNLQETYYLDDYRIIKRRAHGYDRWQGGMVNAGQLSMTSPFAAGALGSTLTNLLAWETALTTGRLINRESLAAMATPATLNDGSRTTYGYGMMVGHLSGHPKLSHGGTINGFRSQLAFYPADDLIVAVLCNHGGAGVEFVESLVTRRVLGLPDVTVPAFQAPEPEMSRHVGRWESDTGPLVVTLEDGVLAIGGGRLSAVGPDTFVMADDPETHVTFASDHDHGDSLVIDREGQLTHARKAMSG